MMRSTGKPGCGVAVTADDRVGDEQGVGDRLLGGVDRGREELVDLVVDEQLDARPPGGEAGHTVTGRHGEEDVARAVPADAADPGEAEPDPPSDPGELAGVERDVGADDADAAPGVAACSTVAARRRARRPTGTPPTRSWRDEPKLASTRTPTVPRPSSTRDEVPIPALCSIAIIPVPAPTAPSATGPAAAASMAARPSATETLRRRASSSQASLHSPTTGATTSSSPTAGTASNMASTTAS